MLKQFAVTPLTTSSSPHTRGPITTGSNFAQDIQQHLSTPADTAYRNRPCIDNFPFTMTRNPEIEPAKPPGRKVTYTFTA